MVAAMTTEYLLGLPDSFAAGTTVRYRRTLSDYPAGDGWTLTLFLAGAKVLQSQAVADGDDHLITLTADDSRGLAAGVYQWVERVQNIAGDVYEVGAGVLRVKPDLTAATDGSQQEWLERAIAALKLHIEGRMPAAMEQYQIAGRVVSKMPIREAIQVLASLEGRLARIAAPESVTRRVLAHFTPTGFEQ